MSGWWVVSDLDGTLLDHRYDWSPAAGTLERLRQRGIPVIPCTSKTAWEVRRFRRAAGLCDPFIVENGGAVLGEEAGGEWRLVLGRPAGELQDALAGIAAAIGRPLRALADCSPAEVTALTGLRGEEARRAREREWSVPFLLPCGTAEAAARADWGPLLGAAAARGLKVVLGNRMAHLIDAATDKGRALDALRARCAAPGTRVLALGDSPNDEALLEAADVAVVVPGPEGPHPGLRAGIAAGRYRLAPAPHGAGWAAVVEDLIDIG
ncbi:MAG: HAD-IIB family hydrolase [Synechococcaceae cyanobacterium]|nr:HAD-IIB family hydrolase [Synechococcaceae cyanobacterium]